MLLSLLPLLACRGSDTGVAPTETDTETWVRPDNRGCLAPPRPVDPDATIALEREPIWASSVTREPS